MLCCVRSIWEPTLPAKARWSVLNCCRCRVMCCQLSHTIELVPNSCSVQCNNNKCACLLLLHAFALFRFTYWRWLLFHHHLRIVEPVSLPFRFITSFQKWAERKQRKRKKTNSTNERRMWVDMVAFQRCGYCAAELHCSKCKGMLTFETHKTTNFYIEKKASRYSQPFPLRIRSQY